LKTESLREKDTNILNLLVENYLKIGSHISSGFIVKKTKMSISSATVRNIMSKLENHGFLYQPHTSAGRIPTDKGLRFYVNSLLKEAFYSREYVNLPLEDFCLDKGDFNSLLIKFSKVLSDYSDNIGFVISPRISKINFSHIKFVKISEVKILIILVALSNFVLTESVETKEYFTQVELDRASRYINENFGGRNLVFIRDYILKEVPKFKIRYEDLISKLTILLKAYFFQEKRENKIFLQGTAKLLEKPDLFDMERLKFLFQSLEEKAKLAKLLSDFISLDRVKVLIGSELNLPNVSSCSLILSHYGYDRQVLGSLGIIGPKRIPYKKIIPVVDLVAKKLSQAISYDN